MTTDIAQFLFSLAFLVGFVVVYFGSAAWTVPDAQIRGVSGGLIFVLLWLFGPLSALVWLVARPRTTVAERSPTTYSNAEDAIDAAIKLDQVGEWDTAIGLYESIAERWPEHQKYTSAC